MSEKCESCQKLSDKGKNVAEVLDEILAASERNPFVLAIPCRLMRAGNRALAEWEEMEKCQQF